MKDQTIYMNCPYHCQWQRSAWNQGFRLQALGPFLRLALPGCWPTPGVASWLLSRPQLCPLHALCTNLHPTEWGEVCYLFLLQFSVLNVFCEHNRTGVSIFRDHVSLSLGFILEQNVKKITVNSLVLHPLISARHSVFQTHPQKSQAPTWLHSAPDFSTQEMPRLCNWSRSGRTFCTSGSHSRFCLCPQFWAL